MKTAANVISVSMLILIAVWSLQACKKTSPAPAPASACTQKNLTATADGSSYTSCTATASNNGTYITIQTTDGNTGASLRQIYIDVPSGSPTVGTAYQLGTGFGLGEYAIGSPTATIYQTNATNTGTLTVTKYDATNRLISATFSFTGVEAYPAAGTTTKTVTGGTFTDIKF